MRPLLKKYGFLIFLTVSVVHLLAIGLEYEGLRFYTKPLLLPVLALTVYWSGTDPNLSGRERQASIFVSALLFSFSGDVLLMFEHIDPLYFIFGLLSFLLAHIMYIIFFWGIKNKTARRFRLNPLVIVLVLAYGLSLLVFLWPSLGQLKIPVAVYALVICSMLLSSIAIQKLVKKNAALYFLAGAFLFVISDSILAINKFYRSFSIAPVLIMLTYCAAQYALAKGFIKHKS